MEILNSCCPVCGGERKETAAPEYACAACGFTYAFVGLFAGERSRMLWKSRVDRAKRKRRTDKMRMLSDAKAFVVGNDLAAFCSPDTKKLTVIYGDGTVHEEDNIVQYSVSGRNAAFLYGDGTVRVVGDNDYGQCRTGGLTEAVYVTCAPDCTYVIKRDGSVSAIGSPADASVRSWSDIRMISCGAYHILGLRRDGRVMAAGEALDQSVRSVIEGWEKVQSIAAANDCSMALFADGRVAFAGRRENDPRREVGGWEDIVSIGVDSSYAAGLTKNGTVRLAGSCKKDLDMGRSTVSGWENMMAVSCGRTGIGGITEEGELLLTGSFAGDNIKTMKKIWAEKLKKSLAQLWG